MEFNFLQSSRKRRRNLDSFSRGNTKIGFFLAKRFAIAEFLESFHDDSLLGPRWISLTIVGKWKRWKVWLLLPIRIYHLLLIFPYFYNLRYNLLQIDYRSNFFGTNFFIRLMENFEKLWLKRIFCICVTNGINHLISLNDRSYWRSYLVSDSIHEQILFKKKDISSAILFNYFPICLLFECFKKETFSAREIKRKRNFKSILYYFL